MEEAKMKDRSQKNRKINYLRLFIGTFVLGSALLTYFHNWNWVYFTMFVGLNIIQFSVTGWCPLAVILKKIGLH